MPRVQVPSNAYRVDIIESQHSWGQKIDESVYFDNETEARQYANDYNLKHNNLDNVPDWYMWADYVGFTKPSTLHHSCHVVLEIET